MNKKELNYFKIRLARHKTDIILVGILLIFTMSLVYAPHFNYDYPLHIDEWRHISEAKKLTEGDYTDRFTMLEIGFHIFLAFFYKISNLVLIYKFFPAIFAGIASLILFFLMYDLTKKLWIGLFAMFFFAFIKSNVNITGIWFFTPLSFCIPLIYLFFWMFVTGLRDENPKRLIISFITYLIILFVHPISATFMIPILFIYSLINIKKIILLWKIFLPSLIVPVIGFLFFSFTVSKFSLRHFFGSLIFRYGWGVLELKMQMGYGYSLIALLFAFIGLVYAYKKKYYLFAIWSISTLLLMVLYHSQKFILFVPYQRDFYYFILSLPILSAFGLYHIYSSLKKCFNKYIKNVNIKETILTILVISVMFFALRAYYEMPNQVQLYKVIDNGDYDALIFLRDYDPNSTNVMSIPGVGTAMFPVSGHKPVATIFFYGNKEDTNTFYAEGCNTKNRLINKHNVKYVYAPKPIACGWELIYNKTRLIYRIQG